MTHNLLVVRPLFLSCLEYRLVLKKKKKSSNHSLFSLAYFSAMSLLTTDYYFLYFPNEHYCHEVNLRTERTTVNCFV